MRWRSRFNQAATVPAAASDQERIVWHLVAEAQAQRALAAADGDMHDVKALGLLGLDGAVIAGLTAARSGLPPLWWVAVIALAVCVPFFLFTILRRPFLLGPHLPTFYDRNIDASAAEAAARLLAELADDMAHSRRSFLAKSVVYSLGLLLFAVGAMFAAGFLARMSVVG